MGMENPLSGSFNRERTLLTFHQRSLEVYASYAAMAGGVGMVLVGMAKEVRILGFLPFDSLWWVFFGIAFALSGLWAYLLFRQLRFDVRKRFYTERFGSGAMVRFRKGSTDEVRCLELGRYQGLLPTGKPKSTAGTWGTAMPAQPGMAYPQAGTLLTLRLWWHDPNRAPIVVEHLIVGTAYGIQDQRTMHFIGLAQAYSQALRVPLAGSL